jgi:hypothetical protein
VCGEKTENKKRRTNGRENGRKKKKIFLVRTVWGEARARTQGANFAHNPRTGWEGGGKTLYDISILFRVREKMCMICDVARRVCV